MASGNSDIAELVAARLGQAARITTLVENRIRPQHLKKKEALPAITYETVTTDDFYHLQGAAGEAQTRIQIDSYGATRREANQVAFLVNDVLSGLGGVWLGEDDAGDDRVFVSEITRDNKYDRDDPPEPGSDVFRYRRVQDYLVTHTEPVPTLSLE